MKSCSLGMTPDFSEMVRAALQFRHQGNFTDEAIARKIVELAKAGERNPDQLCERALNYFQQGFVVGRGNRALVPGVKPR
jgi:hypothetical protein